MDEESFRRRFKSEVCDGLAEIVDGVPVWIGLVGPFQPGDCEEKYRRIPGSCDVSWTQTIDCAGEFVRIFLQGDNEVPRLPV